MLPGGDESEYRPLRSLPHDTQEVALVAAEYDPSGQSRQVLLDDTNFPGPHDSPSETVLASEAANGASAAATRIPNTGAKGIIVVKLFFFWRGRKRRGDTSVRFMSSPKQRVVSTVSRVDFWDAE